MFKKKTKTLEDRKAFYGYMFVLPWIIGFLIFFLFPLMQSVVFAFSDVKIETSGFRVILKGLKNFSYIFFEDAGYTSELLDAFGNFAYSLPFIIIFSLILAVILNQKFKGRVIFS